MNFTPACDGCECGVPVHGLLLESAYLWQLEPWLSLCLSLCLRSPSLYVTFSFSLCPLFFFFFINLPLCLWMTKCPVLPPLPRHPLLSGSRSVLQKNIWPSQVWLVDPDRKCHRYLLAMAIENIQFSMLSRLNKFPIIKFSFFQRYTLPI